MPNYVFSLPTEMQAHIHLGKRHSASHAKKEQYSKVEDCPNVEGLV